MELLLRIIVRNISTEYFSGIFQEKTFKKICVKWSTLYTCSQFLIDLYVGLGSDIFWSVSFEILITY